MIGGFVNDMHQLSRSRGACRLASAKLQELQDKKLNRLVAHAYKNSAFYRKIFDKAGITPGDIRTAEDACKIPITTRQDVLDSGFTPPIPLSQKSNPWIKYETSGSTDRRPLSVYFNKKEARRHGLMHLVMLFENGYRAKDRLFVLTHPQFISKRNRHVLLEGLGIFQMHYMSIFESPDKQIKELIRTNPTIVKGYTPVMKAIAQKLVGGRERPVHPRLIYCTAEYLSPEDRDLIGRAFGADVIDYYSSAESGLMAWECLRHSGYHINSDQVLVELIQDSKKCLPGEPGEVVVTNLGSYSMPFIRYQTGDRAVFADRLCSCGMTLPLLKTILKRDVSKEMVER